MKMDSNPMISDEVIAEKRKETYDILAGKIKDFLKPIQMEVENRCDSEAKCNCTRANTSIMMDCSSNIVPRRKLKEVQKATLKNLAGYLSSTYGPMGSYTQIISGSDQDSTFAKYSKDGLTVLKHILFNKPIEMSIKTEVEEICRYVESRVGDGTTSAVILSYLIFSSLIEVEEKHNLPPHVIRNLFEEVVDSMKEMISKRRMDLSLDDIYNICMISTNGNKEVSKNIADIYKNYDMSVDINVEISTTPDTMIKEYDGITFDEGYSDPAYVNNLGSNTADVHDARIYMFDDPVDDPHMISLFEKILHHNILEPISNNQLPIPTVIMAPRLSRDSSAMLTKIIEALYSYDAKKMTSQKPQVLVITNYLGFGEGVAYDIGKLCGCKSIKKYINPEIEKKEQESGAAPTLETVHEFYGEAELISADANKTKFINPKAMTDNPDIYNGLIKFLENEIITAEERKEDRLYIGRIKERLKRLKENNVDYYVGGIAISDRDALRDLIIDAVKNCKSASRNGVGYAANFEGLLASYYLTNQFSKVSDQTILYDIARSLFQAYFEASKILYGSVVKDEAAVEVMIANSILNGLPYELNNVVKFPDTPDWKCGETVLCSIETDIEILEAAKKIIGLMASSNQCILQSTAINTY